MTGLNTGSAGVETSGMTTTRRRPHAPAWSLVPRVNAVAARHLLSRTTYGATPESLTDVVRMGSLRAWLDRQLTPASIDDTACEAVLARWPLATATAPTVEATVDQGNWDAMQQVVQATLARALWSKRQLFEVMCEFWSNHLNITCPSSEVWSTKSWDDRTVIRQHALGTFEDLLLASSTSPAMLLYLGNAESDGDAPNENYGRELLELHTVGVDAGYTHTDIVNAARVLTGLSVWNRWNGGTPGNQGTLRYRSEWHYVGPVQVMGWSHANGDATQGQAVAESMVRFLARRPETAQRIAAKLAVRFVSDTPPQALVDRLAQVYLAGGTAVVPVLRALFGSAEFTASVGQKQRRPYEDIVGVARSLGISAHPDPTRDLGDLAWTLGQLGQAPLGWGLPDGYPDVAGGWTGAGGTLGRWNTHLGLVGGWWDTGAMVFQKDLPTYLLGASKPTTRGALVDALLARLVPGVAVPAPHRAALIAFLGADGPLGQGDLQWDFEPLVTLVLDMPQGSAR